MSEPTPTLRLVAERVIESISDAISQLMSMTIVLQEKNAPIPAHLASTADAVAESCQRLVQVADDLADAEYEDFEDIRNEIKFAASDVGRAASGLQQAVRLLQSTKDRASAWTRLVEACKVIAERTVLLLQIVYGAELKRIFSMQRRANAHLIAVDVGMVEENRKRFAETASNAATAAVELADALRARAGETVLPMKRDALLTMADALEKQAQDVMDAANAVLRMPGDKPRADKLQDALTTLKKTMKQALVPLEEEYLAAENAQRWTLEGLTPSQARVMETDPLDRKKAIEQLFEAIKAGDKPLVKDALDRVEWELDNVNALAKRVMGVRPEAKEAQELFNLRRRGLKAEVKDAERDRSVKKLEGFWAELEDARAKLMDEIVPWEDRVAQLAQEQLTDMDRIKRALRNGDDGNAVSITKSVFGTHKDLMRAAEACHNGWKKGKPKRMRECITGATGIMGNYVKGVSSAVKDPASRGRAFDTSQELALALEDVCAEALPIEEAMIMAGDAQIKDLRSQHDPNRVHWTELQGSIEQRGPRLERLAREAKDAKDADAERRKLKMGKGTVPDNANVDEALRKLRAVAATQSEAAKAQDPEWFHVNLRHVEAVQDAVAAALTPKSRLVYMANQALEDLRLAPDPERFNKGPGHALEHHVDRVVDEAARVGNALYDGAARERLKKLVDQMHPLRRELAAASDPREYAKLNHRLGDLTRSVIREVVNPTSEIQALAERALRALDNQLVDAPKGDTPAVARNNAELDDAAERLADLADFSARHAGDDYAAKHRIRGAAHALREEQPLHAKHSLRAVEAPKEAEPMRQVKASDRKLRSAIESLVGDTSSPEVLLAAVARQLMSHADELTASARDGGAGADIPTQATLEAALAKRLGAAAERVKKDLADAGTSAQLDRALQDVNDVLPMHLQAVHRTCLNPDDAEAQRALSSDAQALKDAVLAVLAAANSSPEEELRAQRSVARDALLDGCAKARRGQGPAAQAKGAEAAQRYRSVERHARDMATRMNPDVARAAPVEEAAFALRTAAEACPELLKNAADTSAPDAALAVDLQLHTADALTDSAARDGAARLKGEARKMQRGMAGVAAALQKGDPQEVLARMRDEATRFGELAQLAEAEAKTRGGKEEKALLDVVAALKAGVDDLARAATDAMRDDWGVDAVATAVATAKHLGDLAGDLAEGQCSASTSHVGSHVPSDDRRGKRMWNSVSADFVGRDELEAADRLERLLPELRKGGARGTDALEAALLRVEQEAGRLGRYEVSDAVRVAHLARCADADVQHATDEVAASRGLDPSLAASLGDASQSVPRETESLLVAPHAPRADAEQLREAAKMVAATLPAALALAKSGKAADLARTGEASHTALAALAEALDPTAELTLLELRDQAGAALDGLRQGVPERHPQWVAQLAAIRVPLLRALAEALRKADVLSESDDAARGAEELARLWAGLPHTVRSGDESLIDAKAARMEALLDALMQVTAAFPCGLARRMDVDLHSLQVAARAGDKDRAQALAKSIVSDLKDLETATAALTLESPALADKLRECVKQAKASYTSTMKQVPEFLKTPKDAAGAAALDSSCSLVRAPLASAMAAIWNTPDARLREDVRHVEAALARARDAQDSDAHVNDALARVRGLGTSKDVDALRAALTRCRGLSPNSSELHAALQAARRKLWVVAGESDRTDPDGALDKARGQLAAEVVRARRGATRAVDGVEAAARKLIEGTRANYRNQQLEAFDLSKLEDAAAKARKRQHGSLNDVLAEMRNARLAREKARRDAEREEEERRRFPTTKVGAFGSMNDDINANLKTIVVGSPLDFESERAIQLIRAIAGDFATVGQSASEKSAERMIEAGRAASKHISELVAELQDVAKRTPDARASSELVRSAQVLKDFAVRTKLFTSIKAATIHNKGGDEAMVTFSNELRASILQCVQVFYTARIKIHSGGKK